MVLASEGRLSLGLLTGPAGFHCLQRIMPQANETHDWQIEYRFEDLKIQ
ncbi:MAG: hypothetical protein OZ929_05805 [Bryobacterales bacterium]|nr:hypothetical protein [Bryobacterales bacterium]